MKFINYQVVQMILKKIFKSNEFIEEVDYRLRKVSDQSETSRGIKYSNIYLLTPETFKLLLIRSIKCKQYAGYYIYLEKCIKYYNDYQIELQKRYIISVLDKIKKQNKKIDELTNSSNETKEQLNETSNKLNISETKLGISVEDRAVKPIDKSKINRIVILRCKKDPKLYILTCGQKDSVRRFVKDHINYSIVDTIVEVSNYVYLFDHIKDALEDDAIIYKRTIKLLSIEEPEFLDTIRSLFDGRRNIDLSKDLFNDRKKIDLDKVT